MNRMGDSTTSQIEVVREGAEWAIRENSRTLISFFGRGAAVDLGRAIAKDHVSSELLVWRRDESVECSERFQAHRRSKRCVCRQA
jgi:hypothetical protein